MPRRPLGGRRRCRPFVSTGDTILLFLYAFVFFSFSYQLDRAVAFEGFSSFTFGSVPGGEPRFSFNGFGPGGLGGMDAGGNVDNEGYYKVCQFLRSIVVWFRRLTRVRSQHPPHFANSMDMSRTANTSSLVCKSTTGTTAGVLFFFLFFFLYSHLHVMLILVCIASATVCTDSKLPKESRYIVELKWTICTLLFRTHPLLYQYTDSV